MNCRRTNWLPSRMRGLKFRVQLARAVLVGYLDLCHGSA